MNSIKWGVFLTLIAGFLASLVLFLGFYKAVPPSDNILGATGNSLPGPCYIVNGVTTCTKGFGLTQATTTVCAVQSPQATSTLIDGGVNFSVASGTATTITIAKATTQYATTTILATSTIAANAQGFSDAMASTTNGAPTATTIQLTQQDRTFAPNVWMVTSMTGGTGTFSPTGYCHATFRVDAGTL